MEEMIKKAGVLIEALPYIQSFYEKTIVIKYGGAVLTDTVIRRSVLEDIVFMNYVGMRPVLVHGGGPYISKRLEELGKEPQFVKGFRVTDEEGMEIVEQELEKVNRDIVREIISLGGSAISLSGKEDHLIEVKKHADIDGVDLGFVGEVTKINGDVIQRMLVSDIIPVISHITLADIDDLMEKKVITGGMIPKVKACARALERGVKKVHIINGKIPHGLLLEIFTDKGIGTEIVKR